MPLQIPKSQARQGIPAYDGFFSSLLDDRTPVGERPVKYSLVQSGFGFIDPRPAQLKDSFFVSTSHSRGRCSV